MADAPSAVLLSPAIFTPELRSPAPCITRRAESQNMMIVPFYQVTKEFAGRLMSKSSVVLGPPMMNLSTVVSPSVRAGATGSIPQFIRIVTRWSFDPYIRIRSLKAHKDESRIYLRHREMQSTSLAFIITFVTAEIMDALPRLPIDAQLKRFASFPVTPAQPPISIGNSLFTTDCGN